jgi:probable F420-dependent oxidoreductase
VSGPPTAATPAAPGGALGKFGAWLNPRYDDDTRVRFVVETEAMGYTSAWLGFGTAALGDLRLAERALDATASITVATAIVNMWTNDADVVADAYHRIAARHRGRFLLGVGVGHPESIATYRQPYDTMVAYLDALDAAGVPNERRILAALGPRALRLAADRTAGAHPYLVVPDHTRDARRLLGPAATIAPEHKVVLTSDPAVARQIGREFLAQPYLKLRNYTNNLRRYGYTDDDLAHGGSDRLIDALVLHGPLSDIAAGLHAHLTPEPTTSPSRFSGPTSKIRCRATARWPKRCGNRGTVDARRRRDLRAARDDPLLGNPAGVDEACESGAGGSGAVDLGGGRCGH